VAHHKDAIKRIKQNETRRMHNRHYRTRMRNQIKRLREAVSSGDQAAAAAQLTEAVSVIHRVAAKGVIHANKAGRQISRLNAAVKAMIGA